MLALNDSILLRRLESHRVKLSSIFIDPYMLINRVFDNKRIELGGSCVNSNMLIDWRFYNK